jgi:hypothetical protein
LFKQIALDAAILGFEMFVGWTTTAQALIGACKSLIGKDN